MQKQLYNRYTDNKKIEVQCRDLYSNAAGFPNKKAFENFVSHISSEDKYYLVCLSVDLRESNKGGYACGNLVLRKFILQLMDMEFYVFHIQGEKFNILVERERFNELREILDYDNSKCFTVYYGIVDDIIVMPSTLEKARRKGISLMYIDRTNKTDKSNDDKENIIGNKGNTPKDLQETAEHKYLETMWYSTINITESLPIAKDVMVYIFPTEFRQPLESLNLIVVVDDLISYQVFSGKNIRFGFDGILFNINARFDREGHLNVAFFKSGNGECEYDIHTHEGSCIPASFGKRAGKNKEIYPVKQNIFGFCDFVLFDNVKNIAEMNTKGIIEIDEQKYGVHMDNAGIYLKKQ